MQDLLAGARRELRHEPIEKRIRATIGADGRRQHAPSSSGSRAASSRRTPCRVRTSAPSSPAAPATRTQARGASSSGDPVPCPHDRGRAGLVRERAGAGFRFADADLDGYVELDFDAFDTGSRRTSGSRATPASVPPRRRAPEQPPGAGGGRRRRGGGEHVARLLFETNLPVRFYLPREDVSSTPVRSPTPHLLPVQGRPRRTGRGTPTDAAAWTSAGPTTSHCRT